MVNTNRHVNMETTTAGLTRRERERLVRRSEILSAAEAIFAEKSFHKTTLSEIASRAEFGKGTIYNYFPDGKEEILIAIFDQLYDGLKKIILLSFAPDKAGSFRDAMTSFFQRSFDFFEERIDLFMILIKESRHLHQGHHQQRASFFAERHNEIIAALAEPLDRAMKRGDLRRVQPHFLAHLIFLHLKGSHLKHCPQPAVSSSPAANIPAHQLANELTDFILFGVAGPNMIQDGK